MSTNDYSKNIVYLSKEQYQELITNEALTVNGQTITYNDNDIYVTPQAEPITDVKINGTSIGSNGVANIPIAGQSNAGVIKILENSSSSFLITSGFLVLRPPTDSAIKSGANTTTTAIIPAYQHQSVFYGLAKAAGHDEKNSTETLGTYTPGAKAAIQNMLGVTDLISTEESSTATAAHALNSTFMMNGKLHRATAAIAIGDAVEVGTNCEVVKADEVFVKKTDIATSSTLGLISIGNGLNINQNGTVSINKAIDQNIQAGTHQYLPIVPEKQHTAVFYGLSKLAGVDLASETVTVGTYPETSKTAIRNMLGAASPNVIAVQDEQPTDTDTKVWLPETQAAGIEVPTYAEFQAGLAEKVGFTDYATNSDYGVVKGGGSKGIIIASDPVGSLAIYPATALNIKLGTDTYKPIVSSTVHTAVFYGLAKAAGDATQAASDNAVGTYTDDAKAAIRSMIGAGTPLDIQIDSTSIISNGVATIPHATTSNYGVVKPGNGLLINSSDVLSIASASVSNCKQQTGSTGYQPITVYVQDAAAFYGLAKAAGDTTQSASSNAVGTYTDSAKLAIQTMLGIDLQSIASEVEIPLVETVTGTTPSITGQPNTRYICGEVSTLSITPPASGSVDVIFESGSTAAVLTVPNTVKWPAWFDATTLETDTTYEILITDGVYGSVMTWAT